jgi:hypothetical protein
VYLIKLEISVLMMSVMDMMTVSLAMLVKLVFMLTALGLHEEE